MDALISSDCKSTQSNILVYEPPKIEVIKISVEKGFAGSGSPPGFGGDDY